VSGRKIKDEVGTRRNDAHRFCQSGVEATAECLPASLAAREIDLPPPGDSRHRLALPHHNNFLVLSDPALESRRIVQSQSELAQKDVVSLIVQQHLWSSFTVCEALTIGTTRRATCSALLDDSCSCYPHEVRLLGLH
jgi:hypothetical protein